MKRKIGLILNDIIYFSNSIDLDMFTTTFVYNKLINNLCKYNYIFHL
ncbi:hypothetical protein CNEO2_660005 [Clostridium neonatale]|uniref:Uncharacterized protein n=1 Tax=Clostridium neonatale TaxID=137838 RepID=A0AAD2DEW9_9CLOT|nr:hypothetical protein CNEO2_640005 [Clostridium neonatale]CAI3213217.1 hypothetical protein CNEO2_670005 [Clostridium neonatale]CAI3216244.1 hypothetical protein CNEO2_910005 [Clostridium neonatale]CAI3245226.1 hypothetical protein CNEO2_620005 [Clostridium neonatale]CAI3645108.1 hypothetical protein CNEO4_250052 [Clostridium neonatale]